MHTCCKYKKRVLTQRTPVANGDSIRSVPAAAKAQIVTRSCFTAVDAELAAECMARMVSAVTVDDGKTRFRSRADFFSMKNFLTVKQTSATGRFTKRWDIPLTGHNRKQAEIPPRDRQQQDMQKLFGGSIKQPKLVCSRYGGDESAGQAS